MNEEPCIHRGKEPPIATALQLPTWYCDIFRICTNKRNPIGIVCCDLCGNFRTPNNKATP